MIQDRLTLSVAHSASSVARSAAPLMAAPRPRPVEDEPTLPDEPEGDVPIPKIRDPHENEQDGTPVIEPPEPDITPFEPPQRLPVR